MAVVTGANLGTAVSATAAVAQLFTNAGAPTDGTNGTLAGVANPGSLLVDVTTFVVYMNKNTKASPTWRTITPLHTAGAPTDGTSGTGVGCNKGTVVVDTTNGILYINTNTAASPTYTKVGTQT